MEIEAKYAITSDFDPDLIERLELHPYTLTGAGIENHTDTLLDSRDRRITARKWALRIRAAGGGLTLTLKGPNTGSGGVHVRREQEAPLEPPLSFDAARWPEPISQAVIDLVGDEPLSPLLYVAVQRRTWMVKRGARTIGELALDTGVILAAGRQEQIREIELELKGSGARSDLEALNTQLLGGLPLQPETRSKLQRGLALLLHAKWTLDGYTPMSSLAAHYIRRQARAARAAMRDVIEEGSPDAIHDMRVAIRRMRSALLELEHVTIFDRSEMRKLRRRLRAVARRLGEVRDLDIIVERLLAATNGGSLDGVIAGMVDARLARRAATLDKARLTLAGDRFQRTLAQLQRCAILRGGADSDANRHLARDVAGSLLWRGFEALTRHNVAIQLGDAIEMHQARIAAKRLRYMLELFAPVTGGGLARVRHALIAFQEAFGTLQDATITRAAVVSDVERLGDTPEMVALQRDLDAERALALAGARSAWANLTSSTVRVTLAGVIAAL